MPSDLQKIFGKEMLRKDSTKSSATQEIVLTAGMEWPDCAYISANSPRATIAKERPLQIFIAKEYNRVDDTTRKTIPSQFSIEQDIRAESEQGYY